MTTRTAVRKSYKLFIGGKFPRSESGRVLPLHAPKGEAHLANYARASRKDLRDAVQAAAKALPIWRDATPSLRGQILYRMAEVLETRKEALIAELREQTGTTVVQARREVEQSIDRLVWYAGWADKFVQCFGTVNPVAAPYFNCTVPEPVGIIGVVAPDQPALLGVISKLAPALVSGNVTVVIASETAPLTAIGLAEVVATSDVAAGVVNILTGKRAELLPHLASHMGVGAIDYSGDDATEAALLQRESAGNLKRIMIRTRPHLTEWFDNTAGQSPYWIADLCEMKTAWHPMGL